MANSDSSHDSGSPVPSASAEELYTFALRQSSPPSFAEAVHGLDMTFPQVESAAAELLRLRLLRAGHADAGLLVAVPPETARIRRLAPLLRDLADQQRKVNDLWSVYSDLVSDYHDNVLRGSQDSPVEHVIGITAVRAVITELAAASRSEVLTSQPGGARDDEDLRQSLTLAEELLIRGVRMRTLYQHTARYGPATATLVEQVTRQGAEVRTSSSSFARALVFDQRVAVIEDRDDPLSALVVRNQSMVDFIAETFEFAWSTALKFTPTYDPAMVRKTSEDTKAMIVNLLLDGVDDRGVARRLGMSIRTVQRHISEIMRRLGAKNRLHAGYLLHQIHGSPEEPGGVPGDPADPGDPDGS